MQAAAAGWALELLVSWELEARRGITILARVTDLDYQEEEGGLLLYSKSKEENR